MCVRLIGMLVTIWRAVQINKVVQTAMEQVEIGVILQISSVMRLSVTLMVHQKTGSSVKKVFENYFSSVITFRKTDVKLESYI